MKRLLAIGLLAMATPVFAQAPEGKEAAGEKNDKAKKHKAKKGGEKKEKTDEAAPK